MIFDLNINNYNFNEIQQLFNLEFDSEISHEDLKSAKSKVLSMHPDKSKSRENLNQKKLSNKNEKLKSTIRRQVH